MARKIPKRIQRYIDNQIKRSFRHGKPLNQSIAIGFSKARRKYPKYRYRLAKNRKSLIKKMIRID